MLVLRGKVLLVVVVVVSAVSAAPGYGQGQQQQQQVVSSSGGHSDGLGTSDSRRSSSSNSSGTTTTISNHLSNNKNYDNYNEDTVVHGTNRQDYTTTTTVAHENSYNYNSDYSTDRGFTTISNHLSNNKNYDNYNENNIVHGTNRQDYTTTTTVAYENSNNNYNSGYSTNSVGHSTGPSSTPSSSPSSSSSGGQRRLNTAGYYGLPATLPDLTHDTYTLSSTYRAGTAAADGTGSSPALSALALLGFLYFLNLIQDVLQNNNRRRRRSLPLTGRGGRGVGEETEEEEEEEGHYITSYLEEDPVKGGDETNRAEERKDGEQGTTGRSKGGEPRAFSFLEDFFIRLPQALGMRKRQMIDRISKDRMPMGLGGFLTSRLKMISSIMSFLQDPSPSRIRRAAEDIESKEPLLGKDEAEFFLIPSFRSFVPLLVEVFREYLPFNSWSPGWERAFSQEDDFGTPTFVEEGREMKEDDGNEEEERRERKRRHSFTSMNAWYNELGGRNMEADGGVGGVAAKAISLLGGDDVVQQAVKQEAAPALLELSKGLTGAHPHCLQRVLCRLTSHANQLSLLPRVALKMLSSSMVNESEEAMKAGLRGENCSQTFSECDTGSKSGKT